MRCLQSPSSPALSTSSSFVDDGHRVIAAGRREERLLSLQAELGGPDKCHILPLDVRDRAATEALVASLPASWQEVDVCVNVRDRCALARVRPAAAAADVWRPRRTLGLRWALRWRPAAA